MKKEFFLMVLLSLSISVVTKAQLTITGEFRPRVEMRSGYGALKTDSLKPAYLVAQRTRLSFMYQKEWMKTYISIQDVRLWGDDNIFNPTGAFGHTANLDLNEAWMQLSFLNNSSLKIGRQMFNYDDGRLLSARNWNDRAIFYDALLYQFKKNNWDVDLALSWFANKNNSFDNYYPSDKMRTINFLRVHKVFNSNLKASVIALGSGYTKSNTDQTVYMKGSYGIWVHHKKEDFTGWSSFYFQNGKSADGRSAEAWNFNIKADQKIGRFTGGLGASLISGEKNNTAKDELFDLLYGVRHLVYGYMDYFNNLPRATSKGGLNDLYLTTHFMVNKKIGLSLDYHYFALNQKVNDLDKYLGSELDLGVNVNFRSELNLRGGYSVMLPGATMEEIQGVGKGNSSFSSWAYIMLTFKPTIFVQKD